MKISEGIFWVGAIDWNIRDFHGYFTRRGTTYNAYFIKDEKKVLVDTVKYNFYDELIRKIDEISKVEELDYIIINHVEVDHSGSLSQIIERAKKAKIITSRKGEEGLKKYYGENLNIEVVKTGDQLSIGKRSLTFIEAPMLHWPDSMFTYVDGILMPNDAFGQHLASSGRYDDEVDEEVLMEEAAKYYANILMPFSDLIIRKLQELEKINLPIKIIAPSHGVIWRSNPSKIINAYKRWSEGMVKEKMIIVYDTMWKSTEIMARKIAEGSMSQGIEVKVFKLRNTDVTDIVTEILEAGAIVVGSPTINNSMFPTVSAFMNYITGLKPKKKIWAFFGSYGWGGGAVVQMMEMAKKGGFHVYESFEVKYAPTDEELKKCFDLGKRIAQEIKSIKV